MGIIESSVIVSFAGNNDPDATILFNEEEDLDSIMPQFVERAIYPNRR